MDRTGMEHLLRSPTAATLIAVAHPVKQSTASGAKMPITRYYSCCLVIYGLP